MMLDDAPDLLTVDEARQILRIGKNQAYEAVREGEIPSIRIGRTIRIPKHALVQLLTVNVADEANPPDAEADWAGHG